MRLVAMMIVRNEGSRYLGPVLDHLLEFCDEIRVVDDASTDDTADLLDRKGVDAIRNDTSEFYVHEGRARQKLLEHTRMAFPTHIIAIDGDEFVSDGSLIRRAIEKAPDELVLWTLNMQEVWRAGDDELSIRQDGGWKQHGVPMMFKVPPTPGGPTARGQLRAWRIPNKALACGRIPMGAQVKYRRAVPTDADILHFGWACVADRSERHQRYVEHDSGQFHQNRHLESIMWTDRRVRLTRREWPLNLDKAPILARARRA